MSKVLIFMENGFEEIEAVAIIDILRRAGVVATIVSSSEAPVGAHGIVIQRDEDVDTIAYDEYDGVFLPGGLPGADNLFSLLKLGEVLDSFHRKGKLVAAICAAPYILGLRGMLNGKAATCYPHKMFMDRLEGATYVDKDVVVDGNIITSQGPSTSGALGYAMVEYLQGAEASEAIRSEMLYVCENGVRVESAAKQ